MLRKAVEISRVDGVSRRLMPTNCAVATASKRGAFKLAPLALCHGGAGFRAAVIRRQTMLHRCLTGVTRRGQPLDSRHFSNPSSFG